MIEDTYALTFGDNKKTGINSHSKEGVTQKNAHKQRALTKYKKIQDILEKSSNQALKQLRAFQILVGVVFLPITDNM